MSASKPGDEVLLSVLKHHCNLVPWQKLAERRGVVLRFLPVTNDGRLALDRLDSELTSRCRLVALSHCSNVIGAVTDVAKVVGAARSVGAKIMLDGAQRTPHGPVEVRQLGIDFYAFSGHKTYGPTGIGILWGRHELLMAMPPFVTGGQMIDQVTSFRSPPRRFEAGTPQIAAAVGLGAALDFMHEFDWEVIRDHELRLTRRLLDGLAEMSGVRVIGPLDMHDRSGVVSFTVEGFSAETIYRRLDGDGAALQGGYRCAQPLFHALGVDGAARASFATSNLGAMSMRCSRDLNIWSADPRSAH